MLWSLFKILLFVALVIALAYGAQWLLSVTGEVLISFNGAEYVLSPVVVVIGLVVALAVLWLVFKLAGLLVSLLRFINGDNTAFDRHRERNRERKGVDALSESLIALASGDAREATSKAQKAQKYLDRPEVTRLLVAQAAEAAGEKEESRAAYKDLVTYERTRFVGVRGLMRQKLEEGDTPTAMRLAEKAFALNPRHVETQDMLLRLQARDENWDGARKVLSAKLKAGVLPKDVYKRREAVLSLAQAREKLASGATEAARAEAFEANRLSPELVPAAVLAARMHIEIGDKRRAARVIKGAWIKTHHPDLAAAFAAIEPNETPAERVKRFGPLLKIDPGAPETRMLETELHLAAEDFPSARRSLGTLYETHPSARSLSLMAAIERGQGASEAVVRGWLARALGASRGPQWVCANCGTAHAEWLPVCTSCEAFDSLSWTEPTRGGMTTTALPSDMLPLLIGAPDDGPSGAEAPVVPVVAPEAQPAPRRPVDPDTVGTTRDVDETVTLPAGESPPAPQDEVPTTAGTSRM